MQEFATLLKDACSSGSYAYISGDKLGARFQTQLLSVDGDQLTLKNTVLPQFLNKFLSSSSFYLQLAKLSFKSSSIASNGKDIVFKLEGTDLIKRTRKQERFEFNPKHKAYCLFRNPYDDNTLLKKDIIDLSENGLSLVTFAASKLFVIGLKIEDIKVYLDGKLIKELPAAKVRYTRIMVDITGKHRMQIGFVFNPTDN